MTYWLERRDRFGNAYALWVVLALAFVTPLAVQSLLGVRLENDVESWLPRQDPELQSLHWTHQQFPVEERVFVTWKGSSLGDARLLALEHALEGAVDADGIKRSGPPHIQQVVQPYEVLTAMREQGIAYPEAARRLAGVLLGTGPLRIRLTPTARLQSRRVAQDISKLLHTNLQLAADLSTSESDFADQVRPRADWLSAPNGDATETALADNDDLQPVLLSPAGELLEATDVTHDFQLSWPALRFGSQQTAEVARLLSELQITREEGGTAPAIEAVFHAVGSPVMLAVSLTEHGHAERRESLAQLRALALGVGIPAPELHLAGSMVAGTELNQRVARSAWNVAAPWKRPDQKSIVLTSAAIGAALAWLMLRQILLTALVLFVSLFTVMVTVAIVPACGGSMNMVLVVLPTLLFVITLSGAIHVANYWKHAAIRDPLTAIGETCRSANRPCLLAAITTALGLISLVTSSLTPVRDFGIYGAVGSLISVAMVLVVLPALLQLTPQLRVSSDALDHPIWRSIGRNLAHYPNAWTIGSLAMAVVAGGGLWYFQTETKVIRYFPENSSVLADYRFIERQLCGIVPVEMMVRFDERAQEERPLLDRLALVRQLQERVRQHHEISGAISLADFVPPTAPLDEDSTSLQRRTYSKKSQLMQERLREQAEPRVQAYYTVAMSGHAEFASTSLGTCRPGDELWRVTAQVALLPENDYGQIIDDLNQMAREVLTAEPGATHLVTGTVPVFLRTQQAVLNSLIESSVLSFVLMLAVFAYLQRSVSAALIAMVPNVYPNIMVFGVMAWLGQRIDMGSMITASIAIGMAVDGTLHLLTWFQAGLKAGKTRQDAAVDALCHCGPALTQTAIVVGLGLLMLAPADLLLISRFGWLMAALTLFAWYGDVVLLTALLAGPCGKLFEPRQVQTPETGTMSPQPELLPALHVPVVTPGRTKLSA